MTTRTRKLLRTARNGMLALLVAVNLSACSFGEWVQYSSTAAPTRQNSAEYYWHGRVLYARPAFLQWQDRMHAALFFLWPAFVLLYVLSARAAKAGEEVTRDPMGG